ncbi:MAG: hypothetical protein AAB554_02725 [Patescibacteria group bacterium]
MPSSGSKPFFSFLTFAFLTTALVTGAQAIVQWRHPEALGWPDQIESARSGAWGTAAALGLGALLGFICLAFGAFLMTRRRRTIGLAAILFGAAMFLAPHIAFPWTLYASGGSLVLSFLTLKVTDVLGKRMSSPSNAPAKKAG